MTHLFLSEVRCYCRTEAEILQDKIMAKHPDRMVKVVQIKMGPKDNLVTAYMVRSYTKEKKMFDYKSEALAHSITAENAELRESLLKQELLANSITMENLKVVTPEMRNAATEVSEKWNGATYLVDTVYLAMLEAA